MQKRVLRNRLLFLITEKERKDGKLIKPTHIARAVGVTRPTIYAWLNNEVNKFEGQIVTALCDYFECDVSDLLYFETIEDEVEPTTKV